MEYMPDLNTIGLIVQRRAEHMSDESIKEVLLRQDITEEDIEKAFSAINAEFILEVKSLTVLTPVSPIIY